MQAYWSAALFFTSLITLGVLGLYAWDTHRLAQASVRQVENAQTPFLALVEVEKAYPSSLVMGNSQKVWAIENQGNGAAVNIHVAGTYLAAKYGHGMGRHTVRNEPIPTKLVNHPKPIGVGGTALIVDAKRVLEEVLAEEPFIDCTIEYESLAGRRYRTTITRVDEKQKIDFEKL